MFLKKKKTYLSFLVLMMLFVPAYEASAQQVGDVLVNEIKEQV